MVKITLTHEFDCTPEAFWKLFLDKDFNTALYLDVLGFPEFRIIEQTETDTQATRKVVGQPKMNMPAPVMKLLGSGFRYTEEGKLDKKAGLWSWKMTPSTLADKLRNDGSFRVEAAGDRRCRRVTEIVIEAKIFGVGGMVESNTEKTMRDGWDRSAVFMNKWIAEKGLSSAS